MNNSGNGSAVRSHRRKREEITLEYIQHQIAKGSALYEAAKKVGVSVSTLKRRCRELGIMGWPPSRQCRTITGFEAMDMSQEELEKWVESLFDDNGYEPFMDMSGNSTTNNAATQLNTGSGPHSTSMP